MAPLQMRRCSPPARARGCPTEPRPPLREHVSTRRAIDRSTEVLLGMSSVWLVLTIPMEIFWFDLEDTFGPLLFLPWISLYGTAPVLVLMWIATAWPRHRWRVHLPAAAMFGAGAFYFLVQGRAIATDSFLARHRAGWLSEIQDPHSFVQSDWLHGSPVYAFPMGGGLLDNWGAIVRDESDEIGRVNEFSWNDPSAAPWRKLFGGDLVGCHRLEPGWYVCSFT